MVSKRRQTIIKATASHSREKKYPLSAKWLFTADRGLFCGYAIGWIWLPIYREWYSDGNKGFYTNKLRLESHISNSSLEFLWKYCLPSKKVIYLQRVVWRYANHRTSMQSDCRQIVTNNFLLLYWTLSFRQIQKSFLSLAKIVYFYAFRNIYFCE